MVPNPTLIGLQASLQRLEDNIKAAHGSINLESQRMQSCHNNSVFYYEQLARYSQQYSDLIWESRLLGQFICNNGSQIRAVKRRIIGLKASLRQENRNQKAAEKKIARTQDEIVTMKKERKTLNDTITSLRSAEAVYGPLDCDGMEGIRISDMMDLDEMMESDNMDESVLDWEIDYQLLGLAK